MSSSVAARLAGRPEVTGPSVAERLRGYAAGSRRERGYASGSR
ncbi:MAG: hypothetical protein ABIO48_16265 [Pedococcus sp.]